MGAVVIKKLLIWMPFLFGIGFIAPLTAQLMTAWDVQPPLGLSPIAFGLIFGGLWGLYANIGGRWL
ncbi:hypothetical protein GRI75_07660 [Altererythrobacter soli]|uniref:Uncharacterized protein n=1 Tax=Croceibacterium soli TaxID=1739690 RepID=A0A6I4UVP0_9SPHN|nr:hypothetical protein [Croceibacterium soli]MXP41517.1 hypothetical protein [Croceibacterium soli]